MIRRILCGAVLWGVASAPAHAAAQCDTQIMPVIEVNATDSEPRFDYSMTQQEMAAFAQSAQVPAADIYDLTVNALSTGNMRIEKVIKFKGQKLPADQVCVQVSKILINIHIEPVIHIASELHDQGCEFKEYFLHEMKHVEEDRRLIAEYTNIIQRNMLFAFPLAADYNIGPVPAGKTEETRLALQDSVNGAVEATIGSMMRARKERQQAIDNTGEFIRLARVCGVGGVGVKPELR
ncbi:MAG TPA: hypothetical protein VGD95_01065 [Micavibrio sp.]